MQHSTVTRASVDGLAQQEWVFWFHAERLRLVLDAYRQLRRSSPRHKFRAEGESYRRLERCGATLPAAAVPVPDDVREAALRAFVARITVGLWDDRTAGG